MKKERYMCAIARVIGNIEEYGLQYNKEQVITYRIKSQESIAGKLKKKGYEVSFENAETYLNDLAGVRVVCGSEKDVYELGDYLCAREGLLIVRRKDYISKPKENGYRSLHLIAEVGRVRVEIQIRTRAMHSWAEEDHRLCYKNR